MEPQYCPHACYRPTRLRQREKPQVPGELLEESEEHLGEEEHLVKVEGIWDEEEVERIHPNNPPQSPYLCPPLRRSLEYALEEVVPSA